jgi:hypothetical protein
MLRSQLGPAFAPVLNKEICTAYPKDGDDLKAEATMEGVAQPSTKVIWVKPDDG